VEALANYIAQPQFPDILRRFLYKQLNPDGAMPPDVEIPLDQCPIVASRISVFHSAVARFFAPSDLCGAGGMHQERIRCNPNWCGEYVRFDTIFVQTGSEQGAMKGMMIGRVRLLFAFTYGDTHFPCALVQWFIPIDEPDEDTGMWVVLPEFQRNGHRTLDVIHLDSIARATHLIPVFGPLFVPEELHFSEALDSYRAYFVNNYVNHHSHEFLS
jgi:hypothetical protein